MNKTINRLTNVLVFSFFAIGQLLPFIMLFYFLFHGMFVAFGLISWSLLTSYLLNVYE